MARIFDIQANGMIRVSAPAKINLTLEVLGKRPDGYHDIHSVMQTVSLADILLFTEAEKLGISSDEAAWDAKMSLIARAADLFRENTGTVKGASILVQKHIPLLSGLGGDSSDAAATLIGLNQLWHAGLDGDELVDLGQQLGSDVTYFFHGGTALAAGRGEIITPLPPMPHSWIVLIIPEIPRSPGKTRSAYQNLKPSHYTNGEKTEKLIKYLTAQTNIDEQLLFNIFDRVAGVVYPGLEKILNHLPGMGIPELHLVGSGPALFTIFHEQKEAESVYSRLIDHHLQCYLTETI
jgi:4-diphosphocytidyl-2-C-methyl-D-erythritol kinase